MVKLDTKQTHTQKQIVPEKTNLGSQQYGGMIELLGYTLIQPIVCVGKQALVSQLDTIITHSTNQATIIRMNE